MRRAAAAMAASMAAATIFFATPARATPVCDDPLGICYRLCQWHIVC